VHPATLCLILACLLSLTCCFCLDGVRLRICSYPPLKKRIPLNCPPVVPRPCRLFLGSPLSALDCLFDARVCFLPPRFLFLLIVPPNVPAICGGFLKDSLPAPVTGICRWLFLCLTAVCFRPKRYASSFEFPPPRFPGWLGLSGLQFHDLSFVLLRFILSSSVRLPPLLKPLPSNESPPIAGFSAVLPHSVRLYSP